MNIHKMPGLRRVGEEQVVRQVERADAGGRRRSRRRLPADRSEVG